MKAVLLLVALVIVVALLVRTFEPRFAFFPSTGETTTPREFGIPHEMLTIATADGERLRAWMMPAEQPRAHILYFHGNGGNLSIWTPILAGIARQGYSVFAFDYRGYGVSTGRPTEHGLYRDVEAVVEQFWSASPGRPVVYWGRSLGGAMAAYAATVRPPDGLIVESTFPDVRTLMRASPVMAVLAFFATYRFPAAEFLRRRAEPRAPVLVMHGDSDGVIAIAQGRALFEQIPEPKRFVTIRGGDHNDVAPRDAQTYWTAIADFVASL